MRDLQFLYRNLYDQHIFSTDFMGIEISLVSAVVLWCREQFGDEVFQNNPGYDCPETVAERQKIFSTGIRWICNSHFVADNEQINRGFSILLQPNDGFINIYFIDKTDAALFKLRFNIHNYADWCE